MTVSKGAELALHCLEELRHVLLLQLQEAQLLLPLLALQRPHLPQLLLEQVLAAQQQALLRLQLLLQPAQVLVLLLDHVVSLLRLHLLPHPVAQRGLVHRLVGRQGHLVLVPHPHQQQPALRAVHRHLPDDLVEGLAVKLLPYRADAGLLGLAVGQDAIEVLYEFEDVFPGRGLVRDVLYVQLIVMVVPIPRRQDGIQNLLMRWLVPSFLGVLLRLLSFRYFSWWYAFMLS